MIHSILIFASKECPIQKPENQIRTWITPEWVCKDQLPNLSVDHAEDEKGWHSVLLSVRLGEGHLRIAGIDEANNDDQ